MVLGLPPGEHWRCQRGPVLWRNADRAALGDPRRAKMDFGFRAWSLRELRQVDLGIPGLTVCGIINEFARTPMAGLAT